METSQFTCFICWILEGETMGKFCIYCGKKLSEGEVCDCKSKKESEEAQGIKENNQSLNGSDIDTSNERKGRTLDDWLTVLKELIKFPIKEKTIFATYSDIGFSMALLMSKSLAIAIFWFMLCFFVDFSIQVSIQTALFFFIITFVLSFVFAGILFGWNYLFKNAIRFNEILVFCGITEISSIPIVILASVVTILSPFFGGAILLLSGIRSILVIAKIHPNKGKKEDVISWIIFLSYIIYFVVAYIIMKKITMIMIEGVIESMINNWIGGLFDI